jgi:hypothetical protein
MDDVEDGLRATRRHRRRLLADEQHLEPHRLLPRAAPPDEAPTENGCIVASPFERVTMPRRRFPPTGENARKDAVRGRAYSLELGEATVPSVRTGEDARKEEGAALRLPRRNGCRFAGGTPPSRRPKRKTTSTATLDGGARRTMSSARFSGERGHRVGKEQRGGPAAAAVATLVGQKYRRRGRHTVRVFDWPRFRSDREDFRPSIQSNGHHRCGLVTGPQLLYGPNLMMGFDPG